MKKTFLCFVMSSLTWSMQAQSYQVNTEVTNKNVLLEEFTGFKCGNCPYGHELADKLQTILGNRVSIVAVHFGSYANTNDYEFDYTVPEGNEIGWQFDANLSGFPNGSINRRRWPNEEFVVFRLGRWIPSARQIIAEKSPVNLWSKAVYDLETRQLKVQVEGYFTDMPEGEKPQLSILVTQNNVLGLQRGGNMGNSYPHQHMLRGAVNGAFGEVLTEATEGKYFKREYVYDVPESYKAIAVDPSEMNLVVIVSQGKGEVLNTLTVQPEVTGGTLPLRATLRPPHLAVTGRYGYRFLPVVLTNKSNTTLTSATFRVMLNDEIRDYTWKGEIAPFSKAEVRVALDLDGVEAEQYHYQVNLAGLNGEDFEGPVLEGFFDAPVVLSDVAKLIIRTDDEADDNLYRLYDADGKLLQTFGPYADGKPAVYEETLHLEPNTTYCIELTDRWANGVNIAESPLELQDAQGNPLLWKERVDDFGCRLFFKTAVPSAVSGQTVSRTDGALYALDGTCVREAFHPSELNLQGLPAGVYVWKNAGESRKIIVP